MSVTQEWERCMAWLVEHAPGTAASIRPSAGKAAVDDAERATGVSWSPELREFFGLHDGAAEVRPVRPDWMPDTRWLGWTGLLSEGGKLLSLKEVKADSALYGSVWARDGMILDAEEYDEFVATEAGTVSNMFHPEYIPFAGQDAYQLFVDLRRGELRGCIRHYGRDYADTSGTQYASLEAMLAEVAGALEHGTLFRRLQPLVHDGLLMWAEPLGPEQ